MCDNTGCDDSDEPTTETTTDHVQVTIAVERPASPNDLVKELRRTADRLEPLTDEAHNVDRDDLL